jgi:predicted RNA polymerase sigma factor
MHEASTDQVRQVVEGIYRSESRHVLATLIRLLGDFDLAEEALHEAFTAAVEQWPRDGLPANPRTWLISTGRFRAVDGPAWMRPSRNLPGGSTKWPGPTRQRMRSWKTTGCG